MDNGTKNRIIIALGILGLLLGVLAVTLVVVCTRIQRAQTELRQQEAMIDRLTDENAKLEHEIKRLTGPGPHIETPHILPGSKPGIRFTQVPGPGGGPDSRGDIAGKVIGLRNPRKYKIVIYAYTDKWYVQPLVVTPHTDIENDGTWRAWTHLGVKYAAVLTLPSYQPQSVRDDLPRVAREVVAVATMEAK